MKDGIWTREEILGQDDVDVAKARLKSNIQFNWMWAAEQLLVAASLQCFTEYDSGIMNDFAKQVITWNAKRPEERKFPIPFSVKQFQVIQSRLPNYLGQLLAAMRKEAQDGNR